MDTDNTPRADVITDTDLLAERILAGRATDAEWDRFAGAAGDDAAVWRRFAEHAHLAARLSRTLTDDRAEHAHPTATPEDDLFTDDAMPRRGAPTSAPRPMRLHAMTGWLAAAVLALTWAGVHFASLGAPDRAPFGDVATNDDGNAGQRNPGVVVTTAADALDAYRRLSESDGVEIAEHPEQIVLEARPLPDGSGVEVVAVRRLIERRVIDNLYRVAADDTGDAALVPVDASTVAPRSDRYRVDF